MAVLHRTEAVRDHVEVVLEVQAEVEAAVKVIAQAVAEVKVEAVAEAKPKIEAVADRVHPEVVVEVQRPMDLAQEVALDQIK